MSDRPTDEVKNRRPLALVAGAAGLAVLVGGGLGGYVALGHADRTAPTRYWVGADAAPAGAPAPVPAVPANELTGKLLPMPVNYGPGPDLGVEGNDFYVSGERALEAVKDARTGLSSDQRAARDKALAGLKLKGVAGRSYSKDHLEQVAVVQLTQADPQALAGFSAFGKKMLELTGDDREAPKVDGFPDAKCARRSVTEEGKKKEDPVETVECVAVQGDVLVNFRMYGSKLFTDQEAVTLFTQQLNHLKSPGESV